MTPSELLERLLNDAADDCAAAHGGTLEQIAAALEAGDERLFDELAARMIAAHHGSRSSLLSAGSH